MEMDMDTNDVRRQLIGNNAVRARARASNDKQRWANSTVDHYALPDDIIEIYVKSFESVLLEFAL